MIDIITRRGRIVYGGALTGLALGLFVFLQWTVDSRIFERILNGAGPVNPTLALVFLALVIIAFTILVGWTVLYLQRADHARKEAEEARMDSERRFAGAFEHAPIGVALSSPEGRWIKVNLALCRLLGYTEADLLSRGFKEVTHPDDLDDTIATVNRLLAGELESCEVEKRYIHAAGHVVPILLNVCLVRDSAAQPLYFVAQIQDRTSRILAESKMRFDEQRYRSLVEATSAIVWDTPASGAFEKEQQGWGAFTGQTFAEYGGHGWLDVIHPEDRAETYRVWSEAVAHGTRYQVEHRILGRDRTYRNMLGQGIPIKDEDGAIVQWIGVHSDITERLRNEEFLVLQAHILNSIGQAVIVSDPAGTITYANRFAEGLYQWAAGKMLGQNLWDATITEKDRVRGASILAQLNRGENSSGEYLMRRRDGSEFPAFLTNSGLRDAQGAPAGIIGISEDISERKRLEERLVQSQKMEVVGKLAGGVAHEYNSIMTAIIGQSELLLADLPAGHPLRGNATEIRQAVGRAATLTRQLLAYGRKQILQPEIIQLDHMLRDMKEGFRHLLGRRVEVQLSSQEQLKSISADPSQIEQVIINMVMNSADAMPDGGLLTLETSSAYLDADFVASIPGLSSGEYIMLVITDTGDGMVPEVRDRIFEPFFTTKAIGHGTGLGLSTSYGIVKQSGGHITVSSEVGQGTSMRLYFPQVSATVVAPMRQIESPHLPRGTETILLVEDDPAFREMAATLLRRLGYMVIAAANGVEALQKQGDGKLGQIDLLFTDATMPHMTGRALADQVRKLSPHIRLLFTSAFRSDASAQQGVPDEIAFLSKPFTPSALAHKLREVLDPW